MSDLTTHYDPTTAVFCGREVIWLWTRCLNDVTCARCFARICAAMEVRA